MIMRKNMSNQAKTYIDKYVDVADKNRVCIHCGFEHTYVVNKYMGFCKLCNNNYELIKNKKNLCVIS